MEGSIDFLQLLDGDLSSKILSNLDDPADVVRVASISHSWRHFVIASEFSKILYLRLFPETSGVIAAIEENNIIEPSEVETTGSVEVEKLKKNHQIYALLARGLAPSLTKDCIFEAISASSTDHYPEEMIHLTLEPTDRVYRRPSYWSSLGESNPEVPETLTYKLVSKLCFITEINIQPFQVFYDDFPICSAKAVRFRVGHVRDLQRERYLIGDYRAGRRSIEDQVVWTYTSEKFPMVQENCLQNFKLPEPVLAVGGLLQIELFG
ncbi:F-box protein At4g00755-like [Papaver somniferum]|uniref:F-box protein At4g00755-like n=1 Tax=Papaver somniferum TaxID=3469 RepID=UPI000E704BBD|nr:F-box protein At4g00755-like [Papaver somniferum]XP_026409272.1 F-box protein At4g00755-like [Papaver somniferum]XP_026409273.1 F-box protein At4g00755-like [Papaver somniferum]